MRMDMQGHDAIWKLLLHNAFRFAITLGFILVFQALFGTANILPGVAIAVGFTMLPKMDLPFRPWTMFFVTVGLYTLSGVVGEFALLPPWIAFPFYFLFCATIILLTNEPIAYKPNISFLLCFVFSQATPLPWDQASSRILAVFLGSMFVGACILISWYRLGYGKQSRSLKEQIRLCSKQRSYIFRMSFGLAFAMMLGVWLGLKKPLWISIVVMSLTQLEFSETVERIKHRFIGTMVGVVLFFLIFQLLIPAKYAFFIILFLGYLGFFLPEYKYKQVLNAMSALNASLVLLDGMSAIGNRIFWLLAGIAIVLIIYLLTHVIARMQRIQQAILLYIKADDFPRHRILHDTHKGGKETQDIQRLQEMG